jgi:linoleoyl-CoA desaturase
MSDSAILGPIRFVAKDKTNFFPVLRKRVDEYFQQNNISKHANAEMVVKTIVLLGGYLLTYAAILAFGITGLPGILLYIFMGICLAGVGMSVMHDANHGAYSRDQRINDLVGFSLNILGGSVFNWKLQHNVLHHNYTNVATHDEDIKDRAGLKFNPHSATKGIHKYQFIYAFFFYGLITLYWVLAKDLVQLIKFTQDGTNKNTFKENVWLFLKITAFKVIYFWAMIYMPIWIVGLNASFVIGGFLLMHFVAGIVLTVIFQLAHTVEGTTHPLPNPNGIIENDWAIHQLNTTVNFSRHNKWLSWYVGGLNFQVEHHLFPKICHVHYPAIAPIVKATAEEYGIPYLENETFMQALRSHINLLKELGTMPHWNEAIG